MWIKSGWLNKVGAHGSESVALKDGIWNLNYYYYYYDDNYYYYYLFLFFLGKKKLAKKGRQILYDFDTPHAILVSFIRLCLKILCAYLTNCPYASTLILHYTPMCSILLTSLTILIFGLLNLQI